MYVPRHFGATDDQLGGLLSAPIAGDLITPTADGLQATLLPWLHLPGTEPADGTGGGFGVLQGHLARNNPHWQLEPAGESLVILKGPDAYISPRWYASKAEHGRVVPTWNYLTAHVYGNLVVHDEVSWLDDLVHRLSDVHEAGHDDAGEPWRVDDAPEKFVNGQLRAIVGVELIITRIEAKAKLSQNRPAADADGVITGLTERGDLDSAGAVRDARGH
ncbi:FMN-binding negative transcriptional regulator [Microlunatus soli]|uniref:Negative transcriptional regulator, PaiB family n=1 Tax=Microlunatus soli TaxID=630515 RepID=A0A1H1VMU8_9ACTN|nr:FMN-binding negative transcriptional regulator [Microlunatus soli]SDS86218.1 negative transcriptional regulator, PaiB family [Microlunatus soli]